MKLYQKTAMLCLLLVGCGHKAHVVSNKQGSHEFPADYQQKLYEKFAADYQSEAQFGREPSNTGGQLQLLKARLGDLNKLKPGKFEIYVFPKLNQQTHKENSSHQETILGKPQITEVSILAVADCKFFINKQGFAKYSADAYFPASLAQGKRKCSIVEVTSRSMKNLNKSLLREGDEISKRLYMDDSYTVYGLETDFYEREQKQKDMNLKTVGMKFSAGAPSTSALGFIPVDMPVLGRIANAEKVNVDSVFASSSKATDFTFKKNGVLVDKMAIRQISRMNRKFKTPQCKLHKMNYKDYYRNAVNMYWCEGMPWPQVVENSHFVAVTQNISVR